MEGEVATTGFKASGEPDPCVTRASRRGGTESVVKRKKKDDEFSCGIICPLAIGGLFLFASYKFTKSNQVNKPGVYIPPAPPGPFTPIPQPTPIAPVPPLIPTLPIPTPAVGETPSTATPSPVPGVGTR